MTAALDWTALARLGIGRLRIDPDRFWALTPFELALMVEETGAPAPLDAPALAALMALYPDARVGG